MLSGAFPNLFSVFAALAYVRKIELLLLVILTASAAFAQEEQSDNNKPFTLNGHSWASKQAFIDSGSRCGVKNLTPAAANAEDIKLRDVLR